ncbi:MAG TPA: patatin-like phospholipase family protein [Candidatus Methanoperedens sp.]
MVNTVAIACQGGGSHTAFTAGVLKGILKEKEKKFEIVGLSGTSGGAICALLAWYGLLKNDRSESIRKLDSFWADNSARSLWDSILNEWVLWAARMQDVISMPEISPYYYPAWAQDQLRRLLEKHVDFGEIKKLLTSSSPKLLIGAADVLSGKFKVFRNDENSADTILASAAIPTFFRSVKIDDTVYWDGLFSQNPPLREFIMNYGYLFNWNDVPGKDNEKLSKFLAQKFDIDWIKNAKIEKINNDRTLKISTDKKCLLLALNDKMTEVNLDIDGCRIDIFIANRENGKLKIYDSGVKPDELWMIQINPEMQNDEPKSVKEIADRRNELSGNLSLNQEIYFIRMVNQWIEDNYLSSDKFKKIAVKRIRMNKNLEYASKLNRDPAFIQDLMYYGEQEAEKFLKS